MILLDVHVCLCHGVVGCPLFCVFYKPISVIYFLYPGNAGALAELYGQTCKQVFICTNMLLTMFFWSSTGTISKWCFQNNNTSFPGLCHACEKCLIESFPVVAEFLQTESSPISFKNSTQTEQKNSRIDNCASHSLFGDDEHLSSVISHSTQISFKQLSQAIMSLLLRCSLHSVVWYLPGLSQYLVMLMVSCLEQVSESCSCNSKL